MEFDLLHVRARGGIVLLIALDAAIFQAALVHALPKVWSSEARSTSAVNNFSRAFLQSFFFLFPMFVFEVLILRVIFGQGLLSVGTLKWLRQWYVWIIIAATLFAHHWFFERQERVPSEIPLVQVSLGGDSPQLSSSSASSYGSVTNKSLPSSLESVPLTSSVGSEERTTPAHRRHVAVLNYFRQYQLLFDLLIASCAFAVLRTCLPNVKHLWPVSKTIILAAHPYWWIVTVIGGSALVATGVFVLCARDERRDDRCAMHNYLS
jgi:signal transduction histidine kinase